MPKLFQPLRHAAGTVAGQRIERFQARNLTDAILRLRCRNWLEKPESARTTMTTTGALCR